jgi:hypothetical protein
MHFDSAGLGYIFMAVEGLVDGSGTGTGTPTVPYSYHIGGDALLTAVSLPDHTVAPYQVFDAKANGLVTVHLIGDFGKLFNGVDMKNNTTTNTAGNYSLATTLAANISSMFYYED